MPGFRHCPWCQGKGCIACDAEQAKYEAHRAANPPPTVLEFVASLLRTTPKAMLAAKRKVERGCGKNPRFIPDGLPGWETSRFRYCSKCEGGGCSQCPGERSKFVRAAIKSAPEWRPGDIRDVRDAAVKAEADRASRGKDSSTKDEIEAAFMPFMDAEYARQFPNGPIPIFSMSVSDTQIVASMGG